MNYHTSRSSNLAALSAVVLNVSTLTGSTIQTTATANTSSIIVSTLTTRSATYSTLTGSTITTSSIVFSTMSGSTLTVSSITTPVIATATGFTTIGQNTSFPNRSIEIGSDATNTVYFDFHSSDSVYADYSTRIQSFGGSTIGQGHMMIQASTINIAGTSGVGIGTSNPGNAFHVYGASAPAIGMGNSTAANFFQIGAASFAGSYSASAVAGDAVIRTTSGNLMLQTGTGAAAVYVNTSNNIIMNYNSSSPSTYKLCVEQGLSNNNGILISNSNYGSAQQFQLSMVNAGSGNFYSYAMVQTSTSGVAASVPLCLQPNSASVGIGTTAPTGKCHVYGGGQSTALSDVYSFNVSSADSFNGDGGRTVYSESINMKAGDLTWANYGVRVYGARIYIGGGYSINAAQNPGIITMYTNNSARFRIGGNGGIETYSTGNITIYAQATNRSDFFYVYANSSGLTAESVWLMPIRVGSSNTHVGGIIWDGTNLIYANYSDYRMKTDIVYASPQLDMINQIPVREFTMTISGKRQIGFIAHELQTYLPGAVIGEKDAVNEDGSPKIQHITTTYMIPYLLKGIQELSEKVSLLQSRIEVLESQ